MARCTMRTTSAGVAGAHADVEEEAPELGHAGADVGARGGGGDVDRPAPLT